MTTIRFQTLGPTIETSMIMAKNPGMVITSSVKRWSRLSTHPPTYPETSPIAVAIADEMRAATIPTLNETRPAWTILAKMSRPAASVPRMWSRLGGTLMLKTSARRGSLMETHGARAAMAPKTSSIPSPRSARRCRRNRGQTP